MLIFYSPPQFLESAVNVFFGFHYNYFLSDTLQCGMHLFESINYVNYLYFMIQ